MTQEQIDELAKEKYPVNPIYGDALDALSWQGYINHLREAFKAGYAAALPIDKGSDDDEDLKIYRDYVYADCRSALEELVYLKSIKDIPDYKEQYDGRKHIAWATAKKVLAATPTQPNSVQQNKNNNNEMD